METDLIIRFIKDVVLSIAAVTGAYIAIKGLGAWRGSLGGNRNELSRRILIALFAYRDAIDGVRHPMMFSAEMPYPNEARAKRMSDKEIHHHGKAKRITPDLEK